MEEKVEGLTHAEAPGWAREWEVEFTFLLQLTHPLPNTWVKELTPARWGHQGPLGAEGKPQVEKGGCGPNQLRQKASQRNQQGLVGTGTGNS